MLIIITNPLKKMVDKVLLISIIDIGYYCFFLSIKTIFIGYIVELYCAQGFIVGVYILHIMYTLYRFGTLPTLPTTAVHK